MSKVDGDRGFHSPRLLNADLNRRSDDPTTTTTTTTTAAIHPSSDSNFRAFTPPRHHLLDRHPDSPFPSRSATSVFEFFTRLRTSTANYPHPLDQSPAFGHYSPGQSDFFGRPSTLSHPLNSFTPRLPPSDFLASSSSAPFATDLPFGYQHDLTSPISLENLSLPTIGAFAGEMASAAPVVDLTGDSPPLRHNHFSTSQGPQGSEGNTCHGRKRPRSPSCQDEGPGGFGEPSSQRRKRARTGAVGHPAWGPDFAEFVATGMNGPTTGSPSRVARDASWAAPESSSAGQAWLRADPTPPPSAPPSQQFTSAGAERPDAHRPSVIQLTASPFGDPRVSAPGTRTGTPSTPINIEDDAVPPPMTPQRNPLADALAKQRIEAVASQSEATDKPLRLSRLSCVICMEPPTDLTATSCGHVFCNHCLHEALVSIENRNRERPTQPNKLLGSCPVCRAPIDRKAVAGSATRVSVIPLLMMRKAAWKPRRLE